MAKKKSITKSVSERAAAPGKPAPLSHANTKAPAAKRGTAGNTRATRTAEKHGPAQSAYESATGQNDWEAALRKSEERFQSILNAVTDAIITIDKRGIIIGANPATDRMFGYAQDDLIGWNVNILMSLPDPNQGGGFVTRFLNTGSIGSTGREALAQRRDGSTFPVEISLSEVDHLGLFTGIIRDISQRKVAENALRHEHDFNEKIIATAQTVVLVLDPDGRVVRFNPYFEKLSGWRLEEAEGRDWFQTFLPERDRKRIKRLFGAAIDGSRARGNTNPILTKEGEERQIEWSDAPLTDAEGKFTGLLSTGIDVTERRLLEREVVSAAEEERRRTARDLHDGLASLLTGIDYRTQALAKELSKLEISQADEARTISGLIRESIVQTRAISKGLHPVGSHPEDLMNSLRMLASQVPSTTPTTCRFHCKSPVLVEDSQRANHLFRIAQEAVNNAIKHSDASRITLSLAQEKDRLILKILDNGVGFEPRHPKSGGLGLHTMEYRSRAIDGALTIRQRRKGGIEVTCAAPAEGRE